MLHFNRNRIRFWGIFICWTSGSPVGRIRSKEVEGGGVNLASWPDRPVDFHCGLSEEEFHQKNYFCRQKLEMKVMKHKKITSHNTQIKIM
jgi:hypothetical protein